MHSIPAASGASVPAHMTYSFQVRDVFAAWEFLLDGLILTLELSVVTMLSGLVIGLAGSAAKVYGPGWLKALVAVSG